MYNPYLVLAVGGGAHNCTCITENLFKPWTVNGFTNYKGHSLIFRQHRSCGTERGVGVGGGGGGWGACQLTFV